LINSYDYDLPSNLIASSPAIPKDSAKLLVYERDSGKVTHTIFKNILEYIPTNSAIILNDTKVIKARIFGKKLSGGKVEILINSPLENDKFLVYIRGKVKVNSELFFDKNLTAKVIELNEDGTRVVEFYLNQSKLDFENLNTILENIGHIPLPPYIKREDSKSDEEDYQTLFAKEIGAVAAPTASLHFTPELLKHLKKRFETKFITLHVGAGTFKPVECTDIKNHIMHKEFYNIQEDTLKLINSTKPILAIGTTVTRTIEYYIREKIQTGESDLFLHPQNKPKRVDHLLTNFHLPKSTLLMLVASFVGVEKSLELYKEAIKKEYKFYSYGDAMLII
jgi:S-adenosylmethionine:tRNA ribosyltransferase-isomerase